VIVDERIVELRERVGQCIEHLSTQLQVLVVALVTTCSAPWRLRAHDAAE
jgi:hypothetical protein